MFERAVFLYTTMYIQALPDFTLRPDIWSHMAFLLAQDPDDPNVVGFVFTDADYAASVFKLFRAWNHNADEDPDDNIRLTFIIDEDHYWAILYGSFRKKTIKQFHAKMRRRTRGPKAGKEHLGLIAGMFFGKAFSTGPQFGLGMFADNRRKGAPFLMVAMLRGEGRTVVAIPGIMPIKKWHMKIKAGHEMSPEDDEYGLWIKRAKWDVEPPKPTARG